MPILKLLAKFVTPVPLREAIPTVPVNAVNERVPALATAPKEPMPSEKTLPKESDPALSIVSVLPPASGLAMDKLPPSTTNPPV